MCHFFHPVNSYQICTICVMGFSRQQTIIIRNQNLAFLLEPCIELAKENIIKNNSKNTVFLNVQTERSIVKWGTAFRGDKRECKNVLNTAF